MKLGSLHKIKSGFLDSLFFNYPIPPLSKSWLLKKDWNLRESISPREKVKNYQVSREETKEKEKWIATSHEARNQKVETLKGMLMVDLCKEKWELKIDRLGRLFSVPFFLSFIFFFFFFARIFFLLLFQGKKNFPSFHLNVTSFQKVVAR